MGKIALYRKYRSRALGEVVGQDHITSVLSTAIKRGQFSHAYLLTGPRGIGKTSVARIVARLINELPYDDSEHIDIIEIDAASNTGVDNIRDLRDKANIAPAHAKYKIYIIDEVHMLSSGAFNALLKTLEEPPAHVVFILATTEVQKLPATILSRTQRFHFRPVSVEKVAAHLRHIADQEKIAIDDDALELIAARGEGSFRDSISLLDQLSNLDGQIAIDHVENILGLAPTQQIEKLADAVVKHDATSVLAILADFRAQGIAVPMVVDQLSRRLSVLATTQPKLYELIEKLIDVPRSANPELKLTAVLATFATKNTPTVAARVQYARVIVEEPSAKSKPVKKSATKTAEPKSPEPEPEAVAKPTPKLDVKLAELDWDKVIATAKRLNGPAGSLIANASHDFADGVLTLYFRYGLHRKKMDDQKYRGVLVEAIKNTHDGVPEIVIASGEKPKSQAAEAVAAIMGGGEPL